MNLTNAAATLAAKGLTVTTSRLGLNAQLDASRSVGVTMVGDTAVVTHHDRGLANRSHREFTDDTELCAHLDAT